jgi:hypothetical protein
MTDLTCECLFIYDKIGLFEWKPICTEFLSFVYACTICICIVVAAAAIKKFELTNNNGRKTKEK